VPALLLALTLGMLQAPQRADTLGVWEAALRASYDSAVAGDSRGHPPRGLLPWLAPTATRPAPHPGGSLPLDSVWLATLVARHVIRGLCDPGCLQTTDRLRVVLDAPQFESDSQASVDVVYYSVSASPTAGACGFVDFDEVRFKARRLSTGWAVTGRTFLGGGSGAMTGAEWDAHCRRRRGHL
jgi:hypothetical protein